MLQKRQINLLLWACVLSYLDAHYSIRNFPDRLVYIVQNNRSSWAGKSTSKLVSQVASTSRHHCSHGFILQCSSISLHSRARGLVPGICCPTHWKFSVVEIMSSVTRCTQQFLLHVENCSIVFPDAHNSSKLHGNQLYLQQQGLTSVQPKDKAKHLVPNVQRFLFRRPSYVWLSHVIKDRWWPLGVIHETGPYLNPELSGKHSVNCI